MAETVRRGGFGFRPEHDVPRTNVSANKAPAKKKKGAKQGKVDYVNNPAELQKLSSSFLIATLEACREEYKSPLYCAAGEAKKLLIGIPVPFAFEWLTQVSVFPLSRLVQVVGIEGCFKSALCFEIARWFANCLGTGYLFENESKYSARFAQSIFGYADEIGREVLGHIPCSSMDDWQMKLQRISNDLRVKMTDKGGPGRIFPVILILDSIMAKLTLETHTRIEDEGFAGRNHPAEALSLNSFLKKFTDDLAEWPFAFVAVNHLKPKKSATGVVERSKAGGRAPSFHETYELEMQKDERNKISLVDEHAQGFEMNGARMRLVCRKNSLGETHRDVPISIIWTHRPSPVDGQTRQYTRWDWPSATIDILMRYNKGSRMDKVRAIVDIHKTTGDSYWSKRLKVSSKDPLPKHDLGVLLEQDKKLLQELRSLFGIDTVKQFAAGVDYMTQMKKAYKALEAAMSD